VVRTVLLFVMAWAATAAEVRVLSYNIHHGEGMDGRIDLARIAAVIQSVKPDLVAVQEVDRTTKRSGGVDQAAELARLTGLHMVFGRTIDYDGGLYGNAVLSRAPVERWENHPLPGVEPRGLIEVDAGRFTFFATHLDATRDDAKRLEAAAGINRIVAAGARPALLAGDLNAVPGSAPLKALAAAWSIAGNDHDLPTIPAGRPVRQLDYVLYRPADGWAVIEVRVLDAPLASDHRPIFVVLAAR
jgi:endonuclease/exonuclease/phosphatase family metal-dependent hydrolase